ncbi:MAG: sterol desaturase family protein [Deltaproteobacteria bacterium]|nr:sterol desaturase family protein [Deltaproteobacteria bacterium]
MYVELAAAVLGMATWTLAEYGLHRFLGHDRRTWPNPFAAEHTRHHSEGNYFAPARVKVAVGLAVVTMLTAAASLLVGTTLGAIYSASFTVMYAAYEVQHRRMHTHAGRGRWFRLLRRHHFHHHFANPKSNHGVTSPLWDVLFGTYEPAPRVRVPRQLAMAWLLDPATDDVQGDLAGEYEVPPRRRDA